MKNAVLTSTENHVKDTKQYINGNVAEHLILEADAGDNGWLWYLTEEEIEEFEKSNERRSELIAEIKDFINENFNYELDSTNLEVIEKTEKYAILRNCIPSDDEVRQMGGTAFLTGSYSSTPEIDKNHETTCEVLASWGLDTSEDVIVIFDQEWATKIEAEIKEKLNEPAEIIEILTERQDELIEQTIKLLPAALAGDAVNRTFYFEFNKEDDSITVKYKINSSENEPTDFYTIDHNETFEPEIFGYETFEEVDFELLEYPDKIKSSIKQKLDFEL